MGTELLLGEVLNTNAQFLSRFCAHHGLDVYHHVTVGDNWERLSDALVRARRRADLVLISGGLGPTPDDITREVVADIWGCPLRADAKEMRVIEGFFRRRGVPMTENNRRQALLPQGAVSLPNPNGTAPGFYLEHDDAHVAALPGPPRELEPMVTASLGPLLKASDRLPASRLYSRDLLLAGIGESQVAERIADLLRDQDDPSIATYAGGGRIRIRLATRAKDEAEALASFRPVLDVLKSRLGAFIYGYDDETLPGAVGRLLKARGLTLGVAESCTGGGLAHWMTEIPGASDYFSGGLVTYSNASKIALLEVAPSTIERYGAVSIPVAKAMALGAAKRLNAEVSAAITGVAGPSGGTPEKPVGLVCFAFYGPWGLTSEDVQFNGSRALIRERSIIHTLMRLRQHLGEEQAG